jgi:hypothetical protein
MVCIGILNLQNITGPPLLKLNHIEDTASLFLQLTKNALDMQGPYSMICMSSAKQEMI